MNQLKIDQYATCCDYKNLIKALKEDGRLLYASPKPLHIGAIIDLDGQPCQVKRLVSTEEYSLWHEKYFFGEKVVYGYFAELTTD